jgi:hypothetical protein
MLICGQVTSGWMVMFNNAPKVEALDANERDLGVYYRQKIQRLKKKPSAYVPEEVSDHFFPARFLLYYLTLLHP